MLWESLVNQSRMPAFFFFSNSCLYYCGIFAFSCNVCLQNISINVSEVEVVWTICIVAYLNTQSKNEPENILLLYQSLPNNKMDVSGEFELENIVL